MKYWRKVMCILLVLVMLSSLPLCVFATECNNQLVSALNETTKIVNYDGEEIVYTYVKTIDGGIIEAHLSDGTLIERSVLQGNTVIQEIANGKNDGKTYYIPDHITAIPDSEVPNTIDNYTNPQRSSSDYWYDPPLLNDSGLTNSSVFSGYKYLGTTAPDSIYGVSVSVHRKLQDLGGGEAYRFTVSKGTTVSTLAGILVGAFTGSLPLAIATGLATAFLSAGIDSNETGLLKYVKYHYTYKYNCNNSTTYSYKCCECREWWCIYDAQGRMKGYEGKDMMADNHLTINIIAKCQFALQDYVNGTQTNASCVNAAP